MSTSVTLGVSRRRPFADGIAFGEIGAFERLDGVARFTIDPHAPGDVHIVDLDKAPGTPTDWSSTLPTSRS